jgi:hypothetical protein
MDVVVCYLFPCKSIPHRHTIEYIRKGIGHNGRTKRKMMWWYIHQACEEKPSNALLYARLIISGTMKIGTVSRNIRKCSCSCWWLPRDAFKLQLRLRKTRIVGKVLCYAFA